MLLNTVRLKVKGERVKVFNTSFPLYPLPFPQTTRKVKNAYPNCIAVSLTNNHSASVRDLSVLVYSLFDFTIEAVTAYLMSERMYFITKDSFELNQLVFNITGNQESTLSVINLSPATKE